MPLFFPASSAVYGPGAKVSTMADSSMFGGPRPAAIISAFCAGSSIQLSFDRTSVPLLLRNSRNGSASALDTGRLGPMPRTMTLSIPLPLPRMKPAIIMLAPVLTKARVLILPSFEAAA